MEASANEGRPHLMMVGEGWEEIAARIERFSPVCSRRRAWWHAGASA